MAIDKDKARDLLHNVDALFAAMTRRLNPLAARFLRKHVMGQALAELEQFVQNSRPPVLYVLGRSGHGKSTLINALANRQVASVGHVRPHTAESERYQIAFESRYARWDVIDSRGIFETTTPDAAPADDAVEQVRNDLLRYRPDVILYAIAARETRAMAHDFATLRDLLRSTSGDTPPVVLVLTMSDLVDPVREPWPPEPRQSQRLQRLAEIVQYVTAEALQAPHATLLHADGRHRGVACPGAEGADYVIPVAAPPGEAAWNLLTLSRAVGALMPTEARLFFFQAQDRKPLLKDISSSLIQRFSQIAGGVGSSPVPIADTAVLAPLQMLMISCIGGLSCREFSRATAVEFLGAAGLNVAAGFAFREVARQLIKIVPWAGWAASGAVAYGGTYCVGKSAEAYFFSGELRDPAEFRNDADAHFARDTSPRPE